MRSAMFTRSLVLFVGLALILALGVMPTMAEEMTKIAGKLTMTYVKQEKIEIGDTEEHVLALGQSEGANAGADEHALMDGAQVVNISFSDVTRGNGPHQGYVKFAKHDDGTSAKWEGTVTTTLTPEGSSLTTFKGTFSYVGGTGQFKGIRGSGTYTGEFTSETTYTTEWEAEYSVESVKEE